MLEHWGKNQISEWYSSEDYQRDIVIGNKIRILGMSYLIEFTQRDVDNTSFEPLYHYITIYCDISRMHD